MSSFPTHESNIRKLEKLGLDVSEAIKDDEVTLESWGYDELTDLMSDTIKKIEQQHQTIKEIDKLANEFDRMHESVSSRYVAERIFEALAAQHLKDK